MSFAADSPESEPDVEMEDVNTRLDSVEELDEEVDSEKSQMLKENGNGDLAKKPNTFTITEAPDWPSYLINVETDLEMPLGKRLFHWGPVAAISLTAFVSFLLVFFYFCFRLHYCLYNNIIVQISITTIFVHLTWWPINDPYALLNLTLFIFSLYTLLYNMVRASYLGGGYVTKGWHPPEPDHNVSLQYCAKCNGYKAPRSHHCQKCNRCVMKMDHHCRMLYICILISCLQSNSHLYFSVDK